MFMLDRLGRLTSRKLVAPLGLILRIGLSFPILPCCRNAHVMRIATALAIAVAIAVACASVEIESILLPIPAVLSTTHMSVR